MGLARFAIGGVARLAVYACMLFIIGNAIYGSIHADDWISAFFEAALFPAVFFLHPFFASPEAVAWPLADGASFVPALVIALVCYPISTFVGGFGAIDYGHG
jgi:hypothetical protein